MNRVVEPPTAPANWLDRVVATFAPGRGVQRVLQRRAFASLTTGYSATEETRKRKYHRNSRSAEVLSGLAAMPLRNQARHLDRNHDIAKGALDRLTDFIVGANGIQVEPQPKTKTGEIHEEYAKRLRRMYERWCEWPEVTWTHDWTATQRLACRSWLRDGEIFAQIVTGPRNDLVYGSPVPVALEMLEADFVPLTFDDAARNIRQGIQRNSWGRPSAYHVYKTHPGDDRALSLDTKAVPAEQMIHVRLVDRFHQLRGVSVMASVIETLQDVYEYKEAERIAAKQAARMVMKMTHGSPDMWTQTGAEGYDPRNPPIFQTDDGMIVVSAQTGEGIDFFDTKRPNVNAMPFVDGELRCASAGFGLSYSAISRNYNGTYSAQRQEQVENRPGYQAGTMVLVAQMIRPTYQALVQWDALINGVPAGVDLDSIDDALYIGPPMLSIDPAKDADANLVLVQAGFTSRSRVIRGRGERPEDVDQQRKADEDREKRLHLSSAAPVSPAKPAAPPPSDATVTDLRAWLDEREQKRTRAEHKENA